MSVVIGYSTPDQGVNSAPLPQSGYKEVGAEAPAVTV